MVSVSPVIPKAEYAPAPQHLECLFIGGDFTNGLDCIIHSATVCDLHHFCNRVSHFMNIDNVISTHLFCGF